MKDQSCPCGSNAKFAECCSEILRGTKVALTPEALMRSRYTAYVTKNVDYLIATTDPQVRMDTDHQANAQWAEQAKFEKLEVLNSSMQNNKGTVEFRVYFEIDGAREVHHELSKFRRQGLQWFFRDGKIVK
jgi:SEC-C motif-containing protein